MLISKWKDDFLEIIQLPTLDYYDSGTFLTYRNKLGERQRSPEIGPVDIYYNEDDTVYFIVYSADGKKLHRTGGPAMITFRRNDTIKYGIYYNDGVKVGGKIQPPFNVFN